MCIIAIKPAGISMPNAEALTNMWVNNPDGAGFMYAYRGRVYIEKGFMKKVDFDKRIAELEKRIDMKGTPFVLHFRITTHGGTIAANCHPFPISDNVAILQKCSWVSDIGVAHNGIIPITPRKNISDTMEYIVSQLSCIKKCNKKFYQNPHLMKLIENAVHSKLAFLTDTGAIYTIGDFVTVDGMMYSNTSYAPRISYSYYDTDLPWFDKQYYKQKKARTKFTIKPLMFLSDNEGESVLIKNSNGELVEPGDCAIDAKAKLYRIDSDSGCAYRDKVCTLYGTVRFCADNADHFTCYPSLDALDDDLYSSYTSYYGDDFPRT